MHTFVDTMLRRMSSARTDADIEGLLAHLAEVLGYRSGFLLDFPKDGWWDYYVASGLRPENWAIGAVI